MTNSITETAQKKAAKVAGFMFLFGFIVPTLNWALVLARLNVANDPSATAHAILDNEFIFRMGITIELFLSVSFYSYI